MKLVVLLIPLLMAAAALSQPVEQTDEQQDLQGAETFLKHRYYQPRYYGDHHHYDDYHFDNHHQNDYHFDNHHQDDYYFDNHHHNGYNQHDNHHHGYPVFRPRFRLFKKFHGHNHHY